VLIHDEIEPWRELPAEVASLIEPQLDLISEEILISIAREVPEYARPLEGSFGHGLRTGVNEALHQFVGLIREPDAGRAYGREVYLGLGRGELRQGRTLDSLQSAYRVGARVAWRRMSATTEAAGVNSRTQSRLAEAIFAYIDRLAADSVEGFAEEMAQREDERGRRREELIAMLLRSPAVPRSALDAAAESAQWPLPSTVAALACPADELDLMRRRLPGDAITGRVDRVGCAIVSDPAGPARERELRHAARESNAVLGPAVDIAELPASWGLVRTATEARQAGRLSGEGLLMVVEHLDELLFYEAREVIAAIAKRRLESLASLPPATRDRMTETALAYVQQSGNAAAMARALHVHPQTIRHRLPRLRELLGDQLDDPDSRFELEAALRA